VRPAPLPVALALALGAASGGCLAGAARHGPEADSGWTRAANVPEVRQASRQGCGAAALSAVLAHHGQPVPQRALLAEAPPGQRDGLKAGALRDLARARGLRAYVLRGERADLERELARGRPVLVGVMRRGLFKDYPHYEVVTGIAPGRRRIETMDPARGRVERGLGDVEKAWRRSGRVTLVVLPPAPG
jgi:ABC-type bacteriocin/lantibiotic exporter with double-glycine peptidase domain